MFGTLPFGPPADNGEATANRGSVRPKGAARRMRSPNPRRTARVLDPEGRALPQGAPGWMRRARRLANALEQAISAIEVDLSTETAIERAFAAFELGFTDKEIARVAHLVETAHAAIRETPRSDLEGAYIDCARVLHRGLPRLVRRLADLDDAIEVVRSLRREPNATNAIVEGTARLLGWMELGREHAAHAVFAARERQT